VLFFRPAAVKAAALNPRRQRSVEVWGSPIVNWLGQKGVAGGVSFFLCGGSGRPACTPTSDTFRGTATAADIVGPTAQSIAPGSSAPLESAAQSAISVTFYLQNPV
jgi:hypothetical protein